MNYLYWSLQYYFIIYFNNVLLYLNNLECSVEKYSWNLKTEEELNNKAPSSPEDGEITEDEIKSDNNDVEVRPIIILVLLINCSNKSKDKLSIFNKAILCMLSKN